MSVLHNRFNINFVQIPNTVITDTRISMQARLVYIYLRSKPDMWTVYNAEVMKSLGIKSTESMAKYWNELESSGWIIRKKTKVGTFDYELCELSANELDANESESTAEKTLYGKNTYREKTPEGKNPDYNNINLKSNTDLNSNTERESNRTPARPSYPKSVDEVLALARTPMCGLPCTRDQADAYFTDRMRKDWTINGQRNRMPVGAVALDLKAWLMRDREKAKAAQNNRTKGEFQDGKHIPSADDWNEYAKHAPQNDF